MPDVILVDPDDQVVGTAEKLEAHENGLLHRAFSIFILSDAADGQEPCVLLQQRAASKYHCGGLWTNTCCSHPTPDQALLACAKERLDFEMGIAADLKPVGVFQYRADFENGLIEHEVDHVFVGELSKQAAIPFNTNEVQATQWITLSALHAWLERAPQDFTPWFAQALNLVEQALKPNTL